MRILHILAGMPPESGVAAVVTRLAVEQHRLGHEVCVACTEEKEVLKFESSKVLKLMEGVLTTKNVEHPTSNIRLREYGYGGQIEQTAVERGVREVTFSRSHPRAMYFSWGMVFGLGKEIKEADVVHVHSSWTFPVWWGGWMALWYKKTLVMSPHGALNPLQLKHSAWKKSLVGWMDRWLLRRASVIVATCEAEKRWVEAFLEDKREKLKAKNINTNIEHSTSNIEHRTRERPKIVVVPNGVEEVLKFESSQVLKC